MATKTLNATAWINRATSKDATRHNLQHAWRSGTDMVATDGHRMHRILDLAKVDKDVSTDPASDVTSFPDYTQVLPTKTADYSVGVTGYDLDLATLKAIAKLLPKAKPFITLRIENGYLSLEAKNLSVNHGSVEVKYGVQLADEYKAVTMTYSVSFNLNYLIDAVDGLPMVAIKFYGALNCFTVDSAIDGKPVQALIMPIRS